MLGQLDTSSTSLCWLSGLGTASRGLFASETKQALDREVLLIGHGRIYTLARSGEIGEILHSSRLERLYAGE